MVLLTGIFINGILKLLVMRLQSGDVYPPYSSLRTDPLGSKALYESLERCCGLSIARNYKPFYKIKDQTDSVVFFAGAQPPVSDRMPLSFLEEFESFIKAGGRMVVTYSPPEQNPFLVDAGTEKGEVKEKKDKDKKEKDRDKSDEDPDMVSFSERWGITYKKYPLEGATRAVLQEKIEEGSLPQEMSWHSPVYFQIKGDQWSVLYEREKRPVVIERKWGKGTVVLASDSYFLSNEAMLRERHPALLAWLVGQKESVLFDEYLHGMAEDPGVAALARRYQLHGLIGGLLVLAGLYLWKNGSSLIPKFSMEGAIESAGLAKGKDSTSGMMNLLRRSIPGDQIFNVCFREWKKTIRPQDIHVRGKLARIESVAEDPNTSAERMKNAAQAYNRISNILKER
jgi:hypothetical protein